MHNDLIQLENEEEREKGVEEFQYVAQICQYL
jgi:hypothetical protein